MFRRFRERHQQAEEAVANSEESLRKATQARRDQERKREQEKEAVISPLERIRGDDAVAGFIIDRLRKG